MRALMIQADGLTKSYGSKRGITNVSFQVANTVSIRISAIPIRKAISCALGPTGLPRTASTA